MTAKGFIEIPSRSFISLGFELAKVDVQFEKFIPKLFPFIFKRVGIIV